MKNILARLKKIFCIMAILCSGLLVSCSCGGGPYDNMKLKSVSLVKFAETQSNVVVGDNRGQVIIDSSGGSTANYFYIEAVVEGYTGNREDVLSINTAIGYEVYANFVKYEYATKGGDRIVRALFEAKEGTECLKFDIISLEGMLTSSFEIEIVNPIQDFNFVNSSVPVLKGKNNTIYEASKTSKYVTLYS